MVQVCGILFWFKPRNMVQNYGSFWEFNLNRLNQEVWSQKGYHKPEPFNLMIKPIKVQLFQIDLLKLSTESTDCSIFLKMLAYSSQKSHFLAIWCQKHLKHSFVTLVLLYNFWPKSINLGQNLPSFGPIKRNHHQLWIMVEIWSLVTRN